MLSIYLAPLTITRAYCMSTYWWVLKRIAVNWPFFGYMARIMYYLIMRSYNARISHKAKFLGKPVLPHGLAGIFISSGSTIGKGSVIFHQVTIGAVTTIDSRKRGSPVIGEGCYIGAGAKIIGRITIGDNVRIGANAVVHEDIPDNTTVTCGVQVVRQISKRLDNRYYFCRKGRWVYADYDANYQLCPNDGMRPEKSR